MTETSRLPAADPDLAEQFDSREQQQAASALGMWAFLVTEVMFFGGLILAYIVYRSAYHDAFARASHHLNVLIGTGNTLVLITSSLTMAMAVHSAQMGRRRRLILFLTVTLLLGCTFLGLKGYEYYEKFRDHLVPGPNFAFGGLDPRHVELFYSLYFAMTGLHALHMVAGAGVLTVLIVLSYLGKFSADYHAPVEMSGLYWHFVDIVWIFLYPFLYLIR
jgi:cytochrome c oxidase subunit 3